MSKGSRSSRRKEAPTSPPRKDQSLVTSAATFHEDPTPYRVSTPLSEFRVPRFIDLFCGIGGFRIAFERAGGKCVFSSDWDKFSRQTYAANFGETPHGGSHLAENLHAMLRQKCQLRQRRVIRQTQRLARIRAEALGNGAL